MAGFDFRREHEAFSRPPRWSDLRKSGPERRVALDVPIVPLPFQIALERQVLALQREKKRRAPTSGASGGREALADGQ